VRPNKDQHQIAITMNDIVRLVEKLSKTQVYPSMKTLFSIKKRQTKNYLTSYLTV